MNIQTVEMPDMPSLFLLVQDRIHFETLLNLARAMLDVQSGKIWTDTEEHDPGITLLQALCYNVSDLGYRYTLPLQDLLTPAPIRQGEGVFPLAFGPNQTLTCGPITEDDYRRAILDLHSSDADDADENSSGFFYFRNAQLVRELGELQYRYGYGTDRREFLFLSEEQNAADTLSEEITAADTIVQLQLFGTYQLYVELTVEAQDAQPAAEKALNNFLRNNRNLCEQVKNITWVQATDKNIIITADVEDDSDDPALILAQIYLAAQHGVRPMAVRQSAEALLAQGESTESIYQGPQLQHGWITQLPPMCNYREPNTIHISVLTNQLEAIEGIQSISTLEWDGGGWDATFKANYYCCLWGTNSVGGLIRNVTLLKRGQKLVATEDEVKQALATLLPPLIDEALVVMPYGIWRQPYRYYPASPQVPPCYGLQDWDPTKSSIIHLHQFMLPFEQELANGCDQLALLPELLSFYRRKGAPVWGGEWPFANKELIWNIVPNSVHHTYAKKLIDLTTEWQHDEEKELDIIQYLLSYFGNPRSSNILTDRKTFLEVQQGLLRQYSELIYERAAIRIDQVSSLQQRIAARLGLGPELFAPVVALDNLPFYIVEHRELLPVLPDPRYNQEQIPVAAAVDNLDTPTILILTLADDAHLSVGQLIDLILDNGQIIIQSVVVSISHGSEVGLLLSNNIMLRRYWENVLSAQNNGSLRWKNSTVWLDDMKYALLYAEDQSGLPAATQCKRLSSTPYPVRLQVGNELVFVRSNGVTGFTGRVTEIDPVNGCFVVHYESDDGGDFPPDDEQQFYRWYINAKDIDDRFSFMISVVFNRDLIKDLAQPYTTADWITRMIQEEIPAHISAQVHWFENYQFSAFGTTYNRWQENATRVGSDAYTLLYQLSIGMLPGLGFGGIGMLHIATMDERNTAIGSGGDEWDIDYIRMEGLFFVPEN